MPKDFSHFTQKDLDALKKKGLTVKGNVPIKPAKRSKYNATKCQESGLVKVAIKPISVNESFRGRRFKTPEHKTWVKAVLLMLPVVEIPEPPYQIYFRFGFSSEASDWDNCIKAAQDAIAKKYKFNDKKIRRGIVDIDIVKKGQEYFEFNISALKES